MRKPVFASAKTKTEISFAVIAKLISAFVFAKRLVQYLYILNPKFQASSLLLWLYSPVCVGPGRKPRRPVFSQQVSINEYKPDEVLMKEPRCHCIPVYLWLHIDLTVTYDVAGNSCHVVFDTILTQVCSFRGDARSVAKAGVLLQEQEHVGTESVNTKFI